MSFTNDQLTALPGQCSTNNQGMETHVIFYRYNDRLEDADWRDFSGHHHTTPSACMSDRNYHFHGYPTGKEAAADMQRLKRQHPNVTFRIIRLPMTQFYVDKLEGLNKWKEREARKLSDGTYTPLPWAEEPWFKARHESLNHFAHVSREDDAMIAYTPDANYGSENRTVRVSVGRYLNEFYSDTIHTLPHRETAMKKADGVTPVMLPPLVALCADFNKAYGLQVDVKFASTRKEIKRVYLNGPNSCMSKPVDCYETNGVHPVEVYAAGDLQLAYIESEGRITARALVWPEKLSVGRVYGDHVALTNGLTMLGYDCSNTDGKALIGAKLLKLEAWGGYVMPYIDGVFSYEQRNGDNEFFYIGGRNENARYTHGRDNDDLLEDTCTCESCGQTVQEDDTASVYFNNRGGTETWCPECRDNYAFVCSVTGDYYAINRVNHIELHDGSMVAGVNLNDDYFECKLIGDWFHCDDLAGTYCRKQGGTEYLVSELAVERYGLIHCEADAFYYKPENLPQPAPDASDETSNEKVA